MSTEVYADIIVHIRIELGLTANVIALVQYMYVNFFVLVLFVFVFVIYGVFFFFFFFFQAEDGIRDVAVTRVQTCALPIYLPAWIPELEPRIVLGVSH